MASQTLFFERSSIILQYRFFYFIFFTAISSLGYADVLVVVDKDLYTYGESITVTVSNQEDEPITYSSGPKCGFSFERARTGTWKTQKICFNCYFEIGSRPCTSKTLKPGAAIEFVLPIADGKQNPRGKLPEGAYRAAFFSYANGKAYSKPFAIVSPPAPKPWEVTYSCKPLPSRKELKKWPTRSVCGPGSTYPATPPNFKPKFPTVLQDLKDGTFITQDEKKRCYRAKFRRCLRKCLPDSALISTPQGLIPITQLKNGMLVWSRDRQGKRIQATILTTHSQFNGGRHRMATISLEDSRSVSVSVGHPDVNGRPIEWLKKGDSYDGSRVTSVNIYDAKDVVTYDIYLSGETGIYWTNDVPLTSTLIF